MSIQTARRQRLIVWGLIRGNFYISIGPISINVSWFPLTRQQRSSKSGQQLNACIGKSDHSG